MPKTITFDRQELTTLKRKYTVAVSIGEGTIVFQGKILLTAYAKYLIEYLDGRFNSKS